MSSFERAGQPVTKESLVDVPALLRAYRDTPPRPPDPKTPDKLVAFGTSGHRGSPFAGTFNEPQILAVAQAVCDYRRAVGITGPLFLGRDTHAVSEPAENATLEVLAANGVPTVLPSDGGVTPTPALSRMIVAHNADPSARRADGIVVTPSHNPPDEGGIKYNAVNGGPADTDATGWIQKRANEILAQGLRDVRRLPAAQARSAACVTRQDFVDAYVSDLPDVLDMTAISAARTQIGVDPLGGASLNYWEAIGARYRLDLTIVNPIIDPAFGFMTYDHDGKIRMDCSSPDAMAGLVALKSRFALGFGNDPDSDRHGIVTPTAGLMNPNHYLCVAIAHLLAHRPGWGQALSAGKTLSVGKTTVSSALIDRVVAAAGQSLYEVPVGFKWFAPGLSASTLCFGGEESAGASFLRRGGKPWVTDKDGLLLCLLAAEIVAVTGRDPSEHYAAITKKLGAPLYTRIDAPATPAEKAALAKLSPEAVRADRLAGQAITAKLTTTPGNGAAIGGLKVCTANGWFAARPSGTEDIYKIYAESFQDAAHLKAILAEAQALVREALKPRSV